MNTAAISGNYVLSGTAFGEGGPFLVLDALRPHKPKRLRWPVRGQVFTLQRLTSRFCVGRYSLDTYEDWPCPLQSPLDGTYGECPECHRFNGFVPAFYRVPRSSLSPQQLRYNNRPHAVYLAHFGATRVKVGISTVDRVMARLMEQGARVACILTHRDSAYEAREVEAAISAMDGMCEVVQSRTKRSLLAGPFDPTEAIGQLQELGHRLSRRLSVPLCGQCIELEKDYLGPDHVAPSVVDLTDAEPFRISGRGIGVVGAVMVVASEERQFMASLSETCGYVISISDRLEPNPRLVGQGQLRLF